MIFPKHECGLFLTHNEHRDCYEKLDKWIEDSRLTGSFESEEAMQQAIATDECWVLQWYPKTPIGSYKVAAPTLDDLLRCAKEVEEDYEAEEQEGEEELDT